MDEWILPFLVWQCCILMQLHTVSMCRPYWAGANHCIELYWWMVMRPELHTACRWSVTLSLDVPSLGAEAIFCIVLWIPCLKLLPLSLSVCPHWAVVRTYALYRWSLYVFVNGRCGHQANHLCYCNAAYLGMNLTAFIRDARWVPSSFTI